MGLQDRFLNNGSPFSYNNGAPSTTLNGSLEGSKLHAVKNGTPGYSLNGNFFPQVNQSYQQYKDGVINFLPFPSTLDIDGANPISALKMPGVPSLNTSFKNGTYRNNVPEGAQTF